MIHFLWLCLLVSLTMHLSAGRHFCVCVGVSFCLCSAECGQETAAAEPETHCAAQLNDSPQTLDRQICRGGEKKCKLFLISFYTIRATSGLDPALFKFRKTRSTHKVVLAPSWHIIGVFVCRYLQFLMYNL